MRPAARASKERTSPGDRADNAVADLDGPGTEVAALPRRSGLLRRALRLGGLLALFALACSAAGVVGGWSLGAQQLAARPLPSASVLRVPTYEGQSGVTMPDVRGLSQSAASQVVVDAGIPIATVRVRQRPNAADKGTVVAQSPVFGALAPSAVTLTVSQGALVPSVVGQSAASATAALEQLGARVEPIAGYDPGQRTDVVLAISPKPGAPLGDAVKVTVNRAPTGRYLSTLPAVSGGCGSSTSAILGGASKPDSLQCSAGASSSPDESVWLLQKSVDEIRGDVGIDDSASTAARVRVQMLVDRQVVFDQEVRWGKPVPVDLHSSGALRLTMRVSSKDDQQSVAAILGDLQLVGGATAMTRLPVE